MRAVPFQRWMRTSVVEGAAASIVAAAGWGFSLGAGLNAIPSSMPLPSTATIAKRVQPGVFLAHSTGTVARGRAMRPEREALATTAAPQRNSVTRAAMTRPLRGWPTTGTSAAMAPQRVSASLATFKLPRVLIGRMPRMPWVTASAATTNPAGRAAGSTCCGRMVLPRIINATRLSQSRLRSQARPGLVTPMLRSTSQPTSRRSTNATRGMSLGNTPGHRHSPATRINSRPRRACS